MWHHLSQESQRTGLLSSLVTMEVHKLQGTSFSSASVTFVLSIFIVGLVEADSFDAFLAAASAAAAALGVCFFALLCLKDLYVYFGDGMIINQCRTSQ